MAEEYNTSSLLRTVRVFDTNICLGKREELATRLINAVEDGPKSIIFCNVHMLMLSQEDMELASAMAAADFVMPDGVPVAWLQRRLGHRRADVLRGYEAVTTLCAQAASLGKSVGFLGSTEVVLKELSKHLKQRHQGLEVSYLYAPPLIRDKIEVNSSLVKSINSYDLDCLFVGLGCPKQEKWIARYGPELNCSVLAVGAAFDWISGRTNKPPGWIENIGFAWLFRLMQDPRRMWPRYLIYNSEFVIKSVKLLLWDRPISSLHSRKTK